MTSKHHHDTSTVSILFKGGRLPSWYHLSKEEQDAYSQEHVDLMLAVAKKHRMLRLEGFRLLNPQKNWERFWIIEFPTLEGAEAWIEAEMAPPYGRYGYYDYDLSRRYQKDEFDTWVTKPRMPADPLAEDPHQIPSLDVDRDSVVVLMFTRWLPGMDDRSPEDRGDIEHINLMQSVAREHGLIRLEAFQLMAPKMDWHRAWVVELPDLKGAEAWIEAEMQLPHSACALKTIHLSRRWSPEYFARWVPGGP